MLAKPTNMSTAIVHSVNLLSSTKDSLHVGWHIYDDYYSHIQGFQIRYQAEGSHIIQRSQVLSVDIDSYGIEQLHENTYYKICVDVLSNLTDNLHHPCIRATTSVDSLSVALGSTFGAFLALGIIVLFVFLAKWQHMRKLKQHLESMAQGDDAYDSMCQPDGDIEMSDVSMQVQEGTTVNTQPDSKKDPLLQNGEASKVPKDGDEGGGDAAEGIDGDGDYVLIDEAAAADMVPAMVSVGADGGVFVVPIDEAGNVDESVMYPMDNSDMILIAPEQESMLPRASQTKNPPAPQVNPPAIDPPPPNLKKRSSREAMMRDGTSSSSSTPTSTPSASSQPISSQPTANGSHRKDYGGARPKEYSGSKYTSPTQSQQLIDIKEPDESASEPQSNNYSWS